MTKIVGSLCLMPWHRSAMTIASLYWVGPITILVQTKMLQGMKNNHLLCL
jgi:hypothetical protein